VERVFRTHWEEKKERGMRPRSKSRTRRMGELFATPQRYYVEKNRFLRKFAILLVQLRERLTLVYLKILFEI
jgi:hypothetical protein